MDKKQPEAQQATCTNSDSWNCKYCNKTKTCAALAAGQATAAKEEAPANMQVTEKMRAAGDCAWMTADRVDSARVFRAMLAAAPAQPAAEPAKPIGYLNPKVLGPDGKIDAPGALTYSSRPCGGWTFPIYAAAPAQPAAEASRFGSPELQALIIARCVEKDQADRVQEDACHAPPLGWRCTRKAGHEGPCAAVEYEDDKQFVERGMQRIRDAEDAARYRWLRERSSTMFVNISINGEGAEIAATLDSAVDAARKQGATT